MAACLDGCRQNARSRCDAQYNTLSCNFQVYFRNRVIFGSIDKERVYRIVKLYQRIETLCAAHDITVTELCRACGVSRSSLSDLKCSRKQSLSAQTLTRIAAYFGVSVDSLLGAAKAPGEIGMDDFTYALYHETKGLTSENKEKLLEMARFFRSQQLKGN